MKKEKRARALRIIIAAAMAAVCLSSCASYKKYRLASMQSEAKTNLAAIYTAQVSYQGELKKYGETFKDINFIVFGDNRYSYFLGKDVIQAKLGGPYQLPAGVSSAVSADSFTVVAVSNLDKDADLDVWTINDKREMKHVMDDGAPAKK